MFLTTHYIKEAERLCHRIAFIVDGKIVRVDVLKSSTNGDGHTTPLLSFAILIAFGAALFGLSLKNVRRKWIY